MDRGKGGISPEESKIFTAEEQIVFREEAIKNGCTWGTFGHRANHDQTVFQASISVDDEQNLPLAIDKIEKTLLSGFGKHTVILRKITIEINII